jgi:hypothetical protein
MKNLPLRKAIGNKQGRPRTWKKLSGEQKEFKKK